MMLGLCSLPLVIANANASDAKAAEKKKTSEGPDLAFLAFLADMQEVDGELVSPSDLFDVPAANDGKKDQDPNEQASSEEPLGILELINQRAPEKKLSEQSDTNKEEGKNE